MMLSLLHELNSPLFKKYDVDPKQFLEGVAPALENFHNTSGALENQLWRTHQMNLVGATETKDNQSAAAKADATVDGKDDSGEETKKETKDANGIDAAKSQGEGGPEKELLEFMTSSDFFSSKSKMSKNEAELVLNHNWSNEAQSDPDSLAGQLSRMTTKQLFQLHELSAKTTFLLQNHTGTYEFKEGSCNIDNVALLSARACREVEHKDAIDEANSFKHFEPIDFSIDASDMKDDERVAAQFEVLYSLTQSFFKKKRPNELKMDINDATNLVRASNGADAESEANEKKDEKGSTISSSSTSSSSSASPSSKSKSSSSGDDGDDSVEKSLLTTTSVSVVTIEGFLNGGPEDEPGWRMVMTRPAHEFPDIRASM
uniref:Uncharacterized protein n=1 Tax=Craspedostauros australis TaxID=1486917 RepID=A0A7R9ZQV7_9STRA